MTISYGFSRRLVLIFQAKLTLHLQAIDFVGGLYTQTHTHNITVTAVYNYCGSSAVVG